MDDKVKIRQLASGVPGLDDVLGGGIPEFSLNLIAGGPGSGKTTLGHQIMFALANPQRKAIYFSIVGEPPIKMLRYMQQYSFYDPAKLPDLIKFIYLGDEALDGGLGKVLEVIVSEVKKGEPGLVVVDSFRSVVRRTLAETTGEVELETFMQHLALLMTSWQATTFLLGEYGDEESDNTVFTVADSVLRLYQSTDRNSVVRKLQVTKIRGQGQIPGLHTARISNDGYNVFPRLLKPEERKGDGTRPLDDRLSTGSPSLDVLMGGGIPRGYSVLLAGPSGSGKTVLANQFIVEGVQRGEPGIVAVFEKRPNDYLQTTPQGEEFEQMVREKKLEILYLRPLDLSIDETMLALREAVLRLGAKRAVIDSLSGLELALAPTFREDFRESLYRMIGALTALGVTVMSTVELADSYTDLRFSPHGIAFLTDAIVMQRYFEVEGQLRRALSVVKIRASPHSKDLREYEINSNGLLVVGDKVQGYGGILTGTPFKLKERLDGGPEAG